MKQETVIDGRKKNGGARPGAGPKKKPAKEIKIPVTFYVKKFKLNQAKKIIKPIINDLNK